MYTMSQACKEVGMNYETLKFYCNQNLVPNVKRDANNRRVFDEHDIAWIKGLSCLKGCGMSIEEMRQFLQLCLQGPASIPSRKEILACKKEQLARRVNELHEAMAFIDRKQQYYDDVLSGKTKYVSKLSPRKA